MLIAPHTLSAATALCRAACGLLAVAVLGMNSPAFALQPAAPALAPAPGNVDLATSRVYVFVGKTGLGHNHAVIGNLQAGTIQLDAADRAGFLVFDMRTFTADTTDARKVLGLEGETDPGTQKQVNANMLGPEVLDVARHPTATLEIRSALRSPRAGAAGKTPYDLTGTFTLHGVARPVTIPIEAEVVGGIIRLQGGFAVKQTDYGMKPYAKFGGVVGVADELKIYGDIRLVAGPSGAAVPAQRP
ncbi:MAG: YceI family protein [Planctomycetia bacterium]|nr:YceI family protein [Planctomycetia bacterium]